MGTTGRVYYSGAPEPTDYDEIDPGNVLIVDLRADHVDVAVKHLGTWRFLSSDWQMSSDKDIEALEEWLSSLEGKDRTIVKVSLVGQVSVAQKARLDELLEHHADLFAAIETWESHSDLVVIADDADLDTLGYRDLRTTLWPSYACWQSRETRPPQPVTLLHCFTDWWGRAHEAP